MFRGLGPDEVRRAILRDNPDPAARSQTFQFPDGPRLTYDLAAPQDRWVMISHGGQVLDRDFDRWPLIQQAQLQLHGTGHAAK